MEAAYGRLHPRSAHIALLTPGRRDLQQLRVDGEADDVVAAHGFQQRQRGLAAIMAVAAHQDRDVRPVLADAADHVTQDLRHLLARRPLAGPQQRQHGLAREAVEDVDRLEAGAVVVRVEQRQLLLAVHGIVGVVDVEHDARRRPGEAAAVEIDLAEPDPRQRSPVGEVLQPRQRRLAHQVGAGLGASADRDLQRGIGAQRIDVVAVLVAGGDHQHPRRHHLGVAVTDAGRIALVAERAGDRLGKPQPVAISRNTIRPPSDDRRPASNVAVSDLAATGDRPGRMGIACMAMDGGGSWRRARSASTPECYAKPTASSPPIISLHARLVNKRG